MFKSEKFFRLLHICALIFLLSFMMFAWKSVPLSYQTGSEQVLYLHSEKPLEPVHMHSNESLINLSLPLETYWHELYPEYCEEWNLTSWEDNGDKLLSPCDQIDMTNLVTEEVRWYHVDRVTFTMNVTPVETWEPMLVEYKGTYDPEILHSPNDTDWHEVHPNYTNVYHIVFWFDSDEDGRLSFTDLVRFEEDGPYYSVKDVATDLILNEKIANPVCTYWHELYPEYFNRYHIIGWEDNGDKLLSPCDRVNTMLQPDGPTADYHVENVTLSLFVSNESDPEITMYIQFEGIFEKVYKIKTAPWGTPWHEVYPEYCEEWNLTSWEDNCNGVLSYCDIIDLKDLDTGVVTRWHVEEVAIDIIVKKIIHDVAVTHVSSLYPWVYQGEVDPISVNVTNEGELTETVDVYAFYNESLVGNETVVLNPGDNQTLTFYWDTTGVPPGNYTISANATIPVDNDPTDNHFSDGTQEVRLLPWYVKPPYPDYAPSGMPDFDQKQFLNFNFTWCGPVSVANSLWWLDSEYESFHNLNPVPPPTISDSFRLLTAYGAWDDHDVKNVGPLVNNLASLMDTDGIRTGLPHTGTNFIDMQVGISQYLQQQDINPLGDCDGDGDVDDDDLQIINNAMGATPGDPNWNMAADVDIDNVIDLTDYNAALANIDKVGMFYEKTVEFPDFLWIEDEIYAWEDVVLLLEFWNETAPGEWNRWVYDPGGEGGHYVTCAGINSTTYELLLSDPWQDAFEAGLTSGRSPVRHPCPHGTDVHHDTQYVSHDAYQVALWTEPPPSPYPGIPVWEPVGYLQTMGFDPSWHAFIRAAVVTSPLGAPDIAVTDLTVCYDQTILAQNLTHPINVTVTNEGSTNETWPLTVYWNTTNIIGTTTNVSLLVGETKIVTFTWNANQTKCLHYELSAVATPVPGETDIGDNTKVGDTVIIVLPGDVDADCDVDLFDAVKFLKAYGAKVDTPNYDPNLDINCNGQIFLFDAVILLKHYGQKYP